MTLDCTTRRSPSSSSMETRRCQSTVGAWPTAFLSRVKNLSTIYFFKVVDREPVGEVLVTMDNRNGKRFSRAAKLSITDAFSLSFLGCRRYSLPSARKLPLRSVKHAVGVRLRNHAKEYLGHRVSFDTRLRCFAVSFRKLIPRTYG